MVVVLVVVFVTTSHQVLHKYEKICEDALGSETVEEELDNITKQLTEAMGWEK